MNRRSIGVWLLPLGLVASASAQTAAPPSSPSGSGGYITQQQFEEAQKAWQEQFQKAQAAWQTKLDAVQTQLHAVQKTQSNGPSRADQLQEMDDLVKRVDADSARIDDLQPGLHNFLIVGDADIDFVDMQHTPSSFGVGFAPLFLFTPTPNLLFEAGLDIGVDNATNDGSGETSVELSIADASYNVCDYLTVGGGLFVTPFGVYHNHYDPSWINKLPDDPLPFADGGIAPDSSLGIFARGAIPVYATKFTYDLYVSNGPRLINDGASNGTLSWDNYDSNHGSKTIGGRLGFQPIPGVEVGYSFQTSDNIAPAGGPSAGDLLQAVDFEVKRQVEALQGTVDFHTEVVWSHVDSFLYTGEVNPFAVDRNGGYVQLSYRPSGGGKFFENLEPVVRYDWLYSPLEPATIGGDHEQRWTFGVDYWLRDNAVLKIAYELDHEQVNPDNSGVLMQLGLGF